MGYKYQTNVKYEGIEEVEVHYWNFKDIALDYLNDSGRYGDVEWTYLRGVWEWLGLQQEVLICYTQVM